MATDTTTTGNDADTGSDAGTTSTTKPDTGTGDSTTTTTTDTEKDVDWKALARKHENDLRKTQGELDKVRKANETDLEKQIREAEERGKTTATTELLGTLLSVEVRSAATGKLADPADAEALLGDLQRFAKDGKVDRPALEKAIDELVKAKPYLAKAKTAALPGGGKTPSTGFSMNDDIRARAGRG